MRRRELILLLTGLVTPTFAVGQQRAKLSRIGFLGPAPAASFAPHVEALRIGLRELGYVEGNNVAFEFRWARGPEEMTVLATELVRSGVDVIFAPSSTETAAILAATKTVPVVFGAHADPVGVGHVLSLARPGGNATGLTMSLTDLVAKELEVLKEILPGLRRVGVLFAPAAPSHIPALEAAHTVAENLNIKLHLFPVRADAEIAPTFASMEERRIEGFIVLATSLLLGQRWVIAALAMEHRLPSAFGVKENALAGGLVSYAPDAADLARRAAAYIDKILKGSKPADLPVEQASRYELVINLRTAKALGLTIPPALLARADEVIE